MSRRTLVASLASILAAACSSPAQETVSRTLDSPSDMTFACVGLQQSDGGLASVALPLAACGPPPEGTPDAGLDAAGPPYESATPYALILESSRGDVMVAQVSPSVNDLRDSDPLTPGINGLPVGELPVGISTTPDGCWAVTANQGSCDLTAIHLGNALRLRDGSVYHVGMSSAAGAIATRPAAITTLPSVPAPEDPVYCSDLPEGFVYVALPACGLVARIDVSTGEIVDGVKWSPGSPPVIVGSDVVCPSECDAAAVAPPDAGLPGEALEPVALAMDPDGTALYVGGWSSSELARVTLDATGAPIVAEVVELEGAGGITRISATGLIPMGDMGVAGMFSFVYAIGRDGAIHVVEVTPGRVPHECDTQVDRRYLRDETNVGLLACLPVGSPATPPRRANAFGPGIRLPRGTVPIDVQIFSASNAINRGEGEFPTPGRISGTFALVTALAPGSAPPRGAGFYINVNDQNYVDIEDPDDPREADMQLALPHTLRDAVIDRHVYPAGCVEVSSRDDFNPVRIKQDPTVEQGHEYNFNSVEEVRRTTDAMGVVHEEVIRPQYAPLIHRLQCDETFAVWELQTAHPPDIMDVDDLDGDGNTTELIPDPRDAEFAALRDTLFADLGNIPDELWHVEWEGPLSLSTLESRRQGGDVTPAGGAMTLSDPSGVLCELGAQPGDVVELLGCATNNDCGTDEICSIHPRAPQGLSGLCVDPDREDALLGRCEALFTSVRRYTATEVYADKLQLARRPRVLRSSPLDGCTSAAQCQAIHEHEVTLVEEESGMGTELPRYTWTCAADAAMGGPDRCIMTCQSTDQCEAGAVCEGGTCVLGPIPPPECVETLQRYQVRAGEAFVVIGSVNGRQHPVVRDTVSGECVVDPFASPLLAGRFRRDEPPCADLTITGVSPNPCRLEGLTEPGISVTTLDGVVIAEQVIERDTWAIRYRSPGLTVDFVDVAIPIPYDIPEVDDGDFYTPVSLGYDFEFSIAGGFRTYTVALAAHYPSRIRVSPAGDLWVVDSGEGSSQFGYTRGQVIGLGIGPDGEIRLF